MSSRAVPRKLRLREHDAIPKLQSDAMRSPAGRPARPAFGVQTGVVACADPRAPNIKVRRQRVCPLPFRQREIRKMPSGNLHPDKTPLPTEANAAYFA